MNIEEEERCYCGGEVDKRYRIQQTPPIWQGKCFRCGQTFTVVSKLREVRNGSSNSAYRTPFC